VDPLILVDQAEAQGRLPRPVARRVRLRMKYLVGAVKRAEKASGLSYPRYFVEPVLPVAKTPSEYGEVGVLFARVIPTTATGSLAILVQFTAALVLLGSKGTIEAVAAHELTHYVDLVRRLSSKDLAEEKATTLYESAFADSDRLVPPALVFSEKALAALVNRKFKGGLSDAALNKKVSDSWIGKGLPMRWVDPAENATALGMDVIAEARFDPAVLAKVSEIREKLKP
jgi:hypothetical protein